MPPISKPASLSAYALELARAVLEELVRNDIMRDLPLTHHQRDIQLLRDRDSPPLGDRLAAACRGVPLASSLSTEDIAASLAQGDDPWAEDLHRCSHRRMSQPPLRTLLAALRFMALFTASEDVIAINTPGELTVLTIPLRHDREAFWHALTDLMPALAAVLRKRGMDWKSPEAVVYGGDGSGSKSDEARSGARFAEAVEAAMAKGGPVLALATQRRDLPATVRVLCDNAMPLPPLTRQMVLEMLRVTHSATGQIAEEAILDRLPEDHDVASLHPSLLAHAFAATTTLRVADRLADLGKRSEMRSGTTLDDIALPTAVRDDLSRILEDLDAWNAGALDWCDVSASIMFHGPPGNGKTMIASGIAGSAGIPLIATSYADCQRHGHQGDYLRAMHEKVEEAIARAPCVFFLDELDSFMIRNRPSQNRDYNIGIVNGLLEQLTRLNETPGVIVIGAANHLGIIDPAILRPGRFDLRHEIGSPDRSGIERILSGSLNAEGGLDLETAARKLVGCSGAAVAATIRECKAQARREGSPVSDAHLMAAISRAAPHRSDDETWRIALHEAGHVVVTWALSGQLPTLVRVTPDGGEVHDRRARVETRETALNRIAGLLAGRAAENVMLGSVSSGASDDLRQATNMAYNMLHVWGLSGDSLLVLPADSLSHFLPGTARAGTIDAILTAQAKRAEITVSRHQHAIRHIAELLVERAELTAVDLSLALHAEVRKEQLHANQPPQTG